MISFSLHLQILRNSYFGDHVPAFDAFSSTNLIRLISVLQTGHITFPSVEVSCANFAVKLLPFAIFPPKI
jgi:hypothetical protein